MEIHRENIYEYIYQLRDAKFLNIFSTAGKGVSRLQKPDKNFLENTNLAYAMKPNPDKGNIRETFLMNQLTNTGAEVSARAEGDFLVSDSGFRRYRNRIGTKAPLWLFGFLY